MLPAGREAGDDDERRQLLSSSQPESTGRHEGADWSPSVATWTRSSPRAVQQEARLPAYQPAHLLLDVALVGAGL